VSLDLKLFLQSPEEIDPEKKSAQSSSSSAAASGDSSSLKSFFGKVKDIQVPGFNKPDIPLPYDVQCSEMKAYLGALETQLVAVQQVSGKMTGQHRNVASSLAEFGNASTQLGNCETETQFLSNGLSQLGTTANRLGSTFHEQADHETDQFQNRLADYIKAVNCAKEAVKGREKTLAAYHTALLNLESKKNKMEKAKAQTPYNAIKVSEAEKEVIEAESEVTKARDTHESVSDITRQEMIRFQKEKVDHFKSMVVDYVKLQIEFSRKVQNTWEALIPEVDALAQQQAQ
jgi:sorting nexin-1/2